MRITAEKDAGESFFAGSNRNGFDYYSAFMNLGLTQGKQQLYFGDYLVRFCQGLAAWQGFAISKSDEVGHVANSTKEFGAIRQLMRIIFYEALRAACLLASLSGTPFFA